MLSTNKSIILSFVIVIAISSISSALEYSSYIFTIDDIIFFSYENGTQVQVYGSLGQLLWPNGPDVILAKGQHAMAGFDNTNQVYKVCGSKKFAVLTGDPAREERGISGYYAMDANGLGTCKELYTYVPATYPEYFGNQLFIVFAYQDNTQVTVQQDVGNGDYQDVNTFSLDKGEHWANSEISNEYLHIIADKPVSVLTCHDQSYFAPSAGGRWSGTEFYTYLSGIVGWPADLTVIAYDNDTSVTIKDSNDPNIVIWSGTLNSGKAHVESYPNGVYKYFTVTSSRPVTVSAQPWKAYTSSCYQEVFIPDRIGTGVGTDLIGSTLDGDLAYLYILAHKDNTHVELYDSNNGSWQASYTLNMGQAVNANPGNGLWRIISDKDISAYSGGGDYGIYAYVAEFAPLAFNTFPLSLEKVDINEPNSVIPGEHITYSIDYPNPVTNPELTDVNIVDEMPEEVDYISSDPCGIYNPYTRTVFWDIGTLSPGESGSVTLTVKVNLLAEPLRTITNRAVMTTSIGRVMATEITDVNFWKPDIIYVDINATGSNTGMSWDNAYRDLQDALERASAGCGSEIWVAKGTYKPTADPNWYATFQLVDGVPIYGGFPSGEGERNWMINETILDGQIGQNYYDAVEYVITADRIEDAIVDGFTIRGGYNAGVFLDFADVGIVNCKLKENYNGIDITNYSHPYIHNCLFIDNSSYGINCSYSEPVITNSTFDGNNRTPHAIHAISWSDVKLADCTVKNHTDNAIYGYYYTNVEMHRSVIEHNSYTGLACVSSSTLNLTNSVIRFNNNGGIYLEDMSSATIKNNWIHNNTGDYGYGIYICNTDTPVIIRNNTIVNNAHYGIYRDSSAPEPNISNCILYHNNNNGIQISGVPSVNYSCVQGGYNGTGNINADPNFMNPTDPNDFHLDPNSPCIDKGDPNADYNGETDIDGENRTIDGDSNGTAIVDIGADEYYWIVNFFDYAEFANAWMSSSGESNYNDIFDLEYNGFIDYADLAIFCGDWLSQAGWAKALTCGVGHGMGQALGQSMSQSMSQTMTASFAPAEALYPSVLAEQPFGSEISAEMQIEKVEPLKIEQVIKWLEELWLDPETRKAITEDEWLEFIKSVKECWEVR